MERCQKIEDITNYMLCNNPECECCGIIGGENIILTEKGIICKNVGDY